MQRETKPNRLINEKSPYLLQHAYNPVDWYPWGEEAFAKARAEDKPVFLSIGYSTCHWCHVMERESFEVDSIAAIMNELFVNIKVDREERPDVDKVYMTALQVMGENGGWPMSMFLTPELKPFYGGTYFPPEDRYGRIGFPGLLRRISGVWKNERAKITESASGVTKHLHDIQATIVAKQTLDTSILATCFEQASRSYDPRFGGFGGGPKFPRPVVFNFLLRYYERTGNPKALQMAEHTLREMSKGGMYDHIGGGFHRYSVDGEWRVPHFEKMLYDQAQIVNALVDVYLITKNPVYEQIIRETLDYTLRDMTDKDGGFYSAEDADSPLPEATHEKGEGAFYIWTMKDIEETLGNDATLFNFYFGVEDAGNALSDPQQEFIGKNILYQAHSMSEAAKFTGLSETEVRANLARSKVKLFQLRAKRPRPHLDDKIITAWNGLMISAFARAAQALDEQKYSRAAERAADFVIARLYTSADHSLLRRYRDGEARFDAQLDDYAFLAQGLVDLYETSFHANYLICAIGLTQKQIALFWDEEKGGFFDTPGNDASILVRMKERYDGAEPTGNAIAVMNLLRLAYMTDKQDWRAKAEKTLAMFGSVLHQAPFTMPQMVAAYDFSIQKVKQVVIAGGQSDEETKKLIRLVHSRYLPNTVIMFADGAKDQEALSRYAEFWLPMSSIDGKATAYVCEGFVCALPTSNEAEVMQLLEKK